MPAVAVDSNPFSDTAQPDGKPLLVPAIKTADGKIKAGEPGDHHDDIGADGQRGFVDQSGTFLNRKEAGKVAQEAGLDVPDNLHSRHLNKALGVEGKDGKMGTPVDHDPFSKPSEKLSASDPWWKKVGTGIADVGVGALGLGAKMSDMGMSIPGAPAAVTSAMQPRPTDTTGKVEAFANKRDSSIEAQRAAAGETGTDWWRVGGNVAATLPLAALNPILAGAASGALTPVKDGDFAEEKLKQIGLGAAAGKAGEVAGNALAKIVRPTTDAAKKMLIDAGVSLTPGQMSGSVAKGFEEKLKSLPGLGDMLKSGEGRALDSYNVATVNKALEPLGISAQGAKTAREAIPFAQDKLREAYNGILPRLAFNADQQFERELTRVETLAEKMPAGRGDIVKQELKNIIRDRLGNSGTMNGEEWKAAESDLGKTVAGYKASPMQGEKAVGDVLEEVLGNFREGLERSNPGSADALRSINKGYAMLSRIEDASNRSVTQGGAFTPGQLLQEVRSAAKRAGRRKEFAAGDSLMQDWGEAGQKIIGNTIPDSGTAGRWASSNTPSLLAGVGLLPLGMGHSELGMHILRRISQTAQPQRNALADLVQRGGQLGAPIGAIGANAGSNALIPP